MDTCSVRGDTVSQTNVLSFARICVVFCPNKCHVSARIGGSTAPPDPPSRTPMDTHISTCSCIFHSASDTARHRFCSIENTILDHTSSFPAVTKSGNRMNYCGRNSSELSCMSSAAGNQSVVPRFSESPQSCCEEGAGRLVDMYLPFRECKSSTHSGIRTVHEPE